MKTRCPHCGHSYDLNLAELVTLTTMQQTVLHHLADLQQWRRCAVTTNVLADMMSFSPRYVRRYLHELEQLGLVTRVGKRRGWALPKEIPVYLFQPALLEHAA